MSTNASIVRYELLRICFHEIQAASHGRKTSVKKRWADTFKVTEQTLDRWMMEVCGRRHSIRADAGKSRSDRNLKTKMVENVWALKASIEAHEQKRSLSTQDAIRLAEINEIITPGELSVSTANAIARKLGYTVKERCVRVEYGEANEAHVTDGSGSEYFYIKEYDGQGNPIIGVRTLKRAERNRKLRPDGSYTQDERALLYYYSVVDGYSRLLYLDLVVAAGENAQDHTSALQRAWQTKADHPMCGMPRMVFTDNGPLGNSSMGWNLFEELDIELTTHLPYNARAKAKVERPFRTLWQKFELLFLLKKDETYHIEEIRELLKNFVYEQNQKKSPSAHADGRSREKMYAESMATQSPRMLHEGTDLLAMLTSSFVATVDAYGCIRKDNALHEIVDCPAALIGQKVEARKNTYGEVVVLHRQTGSKFITRAFMPLVAGNYRAFKHGANEERIARGREMPAPDFRIWGQRQALPENAVSLSEVRAKKIIEGYGSAEAALLAMADMAGVALGDLPDSVSQRLGALAEEHKGNREKIAEIAKAIKEANTE